MKISTRDFKYVIFYSSKITTVYIFTTILDRFSIDDKFMLLIDFEINLCSLIQI